MTSSIKNLIQANHFNINDFDYELPNELIAQTPALNRTDSRLLDARTLPCKDTVFSQLGQLLRPKDLLVFNNTKVIPARLYGLKATGGQFECLIERITGEYTAWVHAKASKIPVIGSTVFIMHQKNNNNIENIKITILERDINSGGLLHIQSEIPILDLSNQYGHVPLPPYITHTPNQDDESRYQTVYAQHEGAAAAPTAGLHFDEGLLKELSNNGINQAFVTLHVGAGTFLPIRNDDISNHVMHSEWFTVPQATADMISDTKAQGGRVICVGTTSLRALESAALLTEQGLFNHHALIKGCSGNTQLFITPGYSFKVADALITNFHLPKSTLMMLVSAFSGIEHIQTIYAYAIQHQYRFFSYGDAMFLERLLK